MEQIMVSWKNSLSKLMTKHLVYQKIIILGHSFVGFGIQKNIVKLHLTHP
jgi:hypothetical protein